MPRTARQPAGQGPPTLPKARPPIETPRNEPEYGGKTVDQDPNPAPGRAGQVGCFAGTPEPFCSRQRHEPNSAGGRVRLDAGFGAYENVALLAEMGYEVYTKTSGQSLTHSLGARSRTNLLTRVGANAEMTAWSQRSLPLSPYPLDLALERFYTGSTLKHSTLLHYGSDLVTQDLTAWFNHYNGRQLIEAGIKEGKQVFYLHKIKVRSEPAIYLQECCVLFAANFIRWALHWLGQQAQPGKHALDVRTLGIKRQVQVAAHVSAWVIRNSEGRLLRFSKQSAFAGKVLRLPAAEL